MHVRVDDAPAADLNHAAPVRNGRERVLKAARALFLEKGYRAVSMQQIAVAAELRKASIYHHFKDKEALFSDVAIKEFDRTWGRLLKVIEDDKPLAETLFRLAEEQFEMSGTDVGRLLMDFRKFVPETRHEEMHAKLHELIDASAVLFERAIERNEIAAIDPRVAALFFFHMVGAWTWSGTDDPTILPPDPAAGARTVVNVILNGLAGGRPANGCPPCGSETAARLRRTPE